jgi:hypothetical protein
MRAAPTDADGTGLGGCLGSSAIERTRDGPHHATGQPSQPYAPGPAKDSPPPLLLRRGRLMPDDPRHQTQTYKTSAENHAHDEESWTESAGL